MASTLLMPYCKAVYDRFNTQYGNRFGSLEQFAAMYSNKYLGKAFNVPIAREVTFRVRLNPFCSAFTNMVVDVNADNWYSSLCSTLNAKALTVNGKALTQFPVDQLSRLNGVSVDYNVAPIIPVAERYHPIAAPLAYSSSKTEQVRNWFDAAIAYMGLSIGEHIFQTVPSFAEVGTADPDDLAWQCITTFAKNKVDLKNFFESAFDTMPSLEDHVVLSQEMRQKVLNHMYKVMGNMLTNNKAAIKDAFLSEAIHSIKTQFHIESFANISEEVQSPRVDEVLTFDEDLYSTPVSTQTLLVAGKNGEDDPEKKKKNIFQRAIQKGKKFLKKQEDKRAERAVERAQLDRDLAQSRADLKLKTAMAKRNALKLRRQAKKGKEIPPSELPPMAPSGFSILSNIGSQADETSRKIDALLSAVHDHNISQLIGNLFVTESVNMKDAQLSTLQLIADITFGNSWTMTRNEDIKKKTVVTYKDEKKLSHDHKHTTTSTTTPKKPLVDYSLLKKETDKPKAAPIASSSSRLENSVVTLAAPVSSTITVPGMPGLTDLVQSNIAKPAPPSMSHLFKEPVIEQKVVSNQKIQQPVNEQVGKSIETTQKSTQQPVNEQVSKSIETTQKSTQQPVNEQVGKSVGQARPPHPHHHMKPISGKVVRTLSPVDAAKTYGSTHAQALRYALSNREAIKGRSDIFLYSDKILGLNVTHETIKSSLARETATNILQGSFTLETSASSGGGQTFHVIN